METEDLIVNTDQQRFEMRVDEHVVLINYRLHDNEMELVHTEVPPDLEGKGHGRKIVEKAFQYIKDQNYKVVPLCSFVVAYLKRHPEWNSIVAGSPNNS